ncbi:MFS transporter [Kurthia zopfii]|uniref:MFS transporter n=1 Tax=Kurthia zopfii TaxID=1650 RepID=UPI000F6B6BCC|nr:MFS transporter [Kurthia zopfii]VEI08792.1 Inner membrane transport protein yajR [Kurthia zopfii]
MKSHPLQFLRIMGLLDGLSLIILLFISMPLKYIWNEPQFVAINGAIHGGIFILYCITIAFVQTRYQWKGYWTALSVIVAFIPFGNFIFDRQLKKIEPTLSPQPFPYHWIVYGIIFFSFFDLFVQLPIMSTYARTLGASIFIVGIVVGLYSFTNTFGNIFSGIFTDKIGAYRMLFIGLFLSIVSLFSYQLIDEPSTLLWVRSIHGFSSGFITPAAFTLLANMRKENNQGSGSAFTGAFVGLAAIIGPATGGILGTKMDVPDVLGIVAILGTILMISLLFVSAGKVSVKKIETDRQPFKWSQKMIYSYIGAFFLMLSQGSLAYLLPIYVQDIGYTSRMSGTLLSMFGIVAVIIFISPLNRIFDYLNAKIALVIGIFLLAISQMLIGLLDTTIPLYGALSLYGIGFAFTFPAINKLLMEATTPDVRGKAYGYFYAFFSIGTVVGSFLLGSLDLINTPGFTFTSCILFVFCIGISLSFIKRKA